MDFNATIDLIIKDLNEASDIIDDLKKYPGVPALQVELAKSKCRSAGDVIALLKSLSYSLPAKDEPAHENRPTLLQDETGIRTKPLKANPLSEEKKKETKPDGIPSAPIGKRAEPRGPVKKTAETPIIADKFSHPTDLYEEQLGSIKADKDVSEQLKAKKVTNLTDAIGLNDKFLFISEIFDGNKEEYYQAVSRLDKAENLQDAMAIIMSYTGEKIENEAAIQLLDLVKLKFPSNE